MRGAPAKQRVMVTGAGGQLGRALLHAEWPDSIAAVGVAHDSLDIASAGAVDRAVAEGGFSAVVNAAAYTAVDNAERDRDRAFAVNHQGALNLARACARNGAVLVHVSTDYVFDGTKPEPYVESDPINPASIYGRSKAAGEEAIRAHLDRHVILRTAWLFSAGPNNFVSRILQLAQQRPELTIVSDQMGNPTSATDLASAIVRLLHTALMRDDGIPWGTYHCVNAEAASWHDLARAAIDQAGPRLPCRAAVRSIASADYPQAAPRPANSRLDCGKIDSAFGIRLCPWREALAPIVNEIVTELRP